MTTIAEKEGRCPVCRWTLSATPKEGCVIGDCSYRPAQGSDEYNRIKARREKSAEGIDPDSPTPIILTVPVFTIESAPKDRAMMLTIKGRWFEGKWDEQPFSKKTRPYYWRSIFYEHIYGVLMMRENQPTHWAEVSSMQIPGGSE